MIEELIQETVSAQSARLTHFRGVLDRMFQEALARHRGSVESTLLLASMLKVEQAGRAVEALTAVQCVEEIQSIGRTLVEVVVNAAYLQFADKREIARFLRFHPESRQHLRAARTHSVAARVKRKVSQLVLNGKPLGGREADPNWSSLSLLERARYADDLSHIPVMSLLVERCHRRGVAATHGTIATLHTFVAEVRTLQPTRPELRLRDLGEALFAVNLSFLTLLMYLNLHLGLHMDEVIGLAASAEADAPQTLLANR
jgi:hypothetical protein